MKNMINQWVYQATKSTAEKDARVGFLSVHRCPLYCVSEDRCMARANSESVAASKRLLCRSDDYDDCPSYLAYLLRRSKALRCDSDWLDAAQ